MLKRIITSIVVACFAAPILVFSHTWFFPIAIGAVSVVCLFEMFRCMKLQKNLLLTIPAYLISIVVPIIQRLLLSPATVMCVCAILFFVYVLYVFVLVIWSHGRLSYNDVAACVFTCLYILLSLNMILYIRDFGDVGKYVYLFVIIGACITDIFAYFTGILFGKHKLIEDVSPKKTIEGSIGGTVFCIIAFVVAGLIIDFCFDRNANIIFLAVGGFFVAVIAQIGDLIMSVIKRHYGIKDFGKIFPGHGGMLDRFDSILAVSLGVGAMCMVSVITGIEML